MEWNKHSLMLLTIKDSVHYFVLVFYYGVQNLCYLKIEKRPTNIKKNRCLLDLMQKQKNHNTTEQKALFYLYTQNTILMAEDLCKMNATIAKLAREAHGSIKSLMYCSGNLPNVKQKTHQVFPILLEKSIEAMGSWFNKIINLITKIPKTCMSLDIWPC